SMVWRDGTSVEIVLGESLLNVGTSDFSNTGEQGIAVIVSDVLGGIKVGDIINLIHFEDHVSFEIGYFGLISELEGFVGRLGVVPEGGAEGGVYLAVMVIAIPEPSTYAVFAGAGLAGLVLLRRVRRRV